jgi:protoporphyrinogen oxidase
MGTKRKAIIIGAGPAGLTAAYELQKNTDIEPVIYEMSDEIGGISRTVNYKGNRIDIGGHRFFSKSDRVMEWWQNILPLQGAPSRDDRKLNRDIPLSSAQNAPDPEKEDKVLLVRNRLSRIFFLRRFFPYPISLNLQTILNLGIWRCVKIGISYFWIRLFPIRKEKSLADFYINRFGKELYNTFFRDYTTKVWGITPDNISPEWGAQRVKGLSISKAVLHALRALVKKDKSIGQKGTETSLIEQFTYPKYGPGQMWETVADLVQKQGGKLFMKKKCTGFLYDGENITAAEITDRENGEKEIVTGNFYFSTMPVKDLILSMGDKVESSAKKVAEGLLYRDFITVGLLLKKLKVKNKSPHPTVNDIVPDNWIYIQERDVIVGRVQVFNNWSPYLVADENNVWLGLEYFLNESDEMWHWEDSKMAQLGIDEMVKIDIIDRNDVLDSVVIRTAKTYPAYFGSYDQFEHIRHFVDSIPNLYMVGRNGLHRYNNQDHSMLTAMTAVDNIAKGITSKTNIWEVNTETEYHEAKTGMNKKLKKS